MTDSLGTASGSITLDAGGAIRALDSVKRGLSDVDRQSSKFGTGLLAGIQKNEQALNTLGQGFIGMGLAVVGAFGLGINTAANFEQSMDGVSAALGGVGTASGITEAQFAKLNEEALRIGSTTSKSATESAQAMDLMAKAGIPVETIINGGAQAVVNLSEATGELLPQSASTFSSMMLLFEDTGISSSEMADQITGSLNNSKATLSEFETGMARLAPVIKGGSLSFGEAATSIAYFNQQGFGAAETGTSLASIFTSVTVPATQEAKDALDALGIQAFDTNGAFIGFPALFDQVATATAGMTEEQKASILSAAFMTDGLDLLNVATVTTGDEMLALEGKIEAPGQAAEASRIRMDNFKGSVEQLGGSIETFAIKLFTGVLPVIRAVVDGLTSLIGFLSGLPTPVLTAIAAFTGLAGALSLAAGGFLLMLPRIANTIVAFKSLFAAANVATGVAAGPLAGLAATIGALIVPILLIVAALALLFVAYKTNFLGFADGVNAVASMIADAFSSIVDAVSGFVDVFTASFDRLTSTTYKWGDTVDDITSGMNPLVAVFHAFAAALRSINGDNTPAWLVSLAEAFDTIGIKVQKFIDIFHQANRAMDPLSAALAALAGVFPGLQKAITPILKVIDNVRKAFKTFAAVFREASNAMDPLSSALAALGAVFPGLMQFITPLLEKIAQFRMYLALLRLEVNPVHAALLALGLVFPILGGFIDGVIEAWAHFGEMLTNIGEALAAFLSGDWREGFQQLGEAARNAADAVITALSAIGTLIADMFEAIDWGAVGSALQAGAVAAFSWLQSFGGQVMQWLQQAFDAIPWGDLWNGVQDASSTIIGKLGDLAGAAIEWAQGAFEAIDWTSLFNSVVDVTQSIISKLGDLGNAAIQWAINAFSTINWTSLFNSVVDVTQTIISKLGDLLGAIGTWITNAVPGADKWLELAGNAGDLVSGIVEKFGDLLSGVIGWIADGVPSFDNWKLILTSLGDLTSAVREKLGDLAAAVISWITSAVPGAAAWANLIVSAGELAQQVITKFGNLAAAVISWITSAVPGASAWANLIVSAGELASKAVKKFGDLARAVVGWITAAVPSAATWSVIYTGATNIVGKVVKAFGDLARAVVSWITSAVPGAAIWANIYTSVTDITGAIVENLGDLAGAIGEWATKAYNAAAAVLNTLGDLIPIIGGSGEEEEEPGVAGSGRPGFDTGQNASRLAQPVVIPSVDEINRAKDAADKLYASLKTLVSGLITTGQTFTQLYATLTPVVSGLITTGQTFTQLYTVLTTVVSGLITVGTTFTQLYTVLTTVVSGLITTGLTFTQLYATLPPIVSGLITVGTTFTQLYTVLTTVVSGLITTGLTFTQLYATMPPIVSGLITLGSTFTQLYAVLTTIVSGLITTGTTFTQLGVVVVNLGVAFATFVGTTLGLMSGWQTGITAMVNATMQNMVGTITSQVSASASSISTFVSSSLAQFGGWSKGVMSIVNSTMQSAYGTISSQMSASTSSITQFVSTTRSSISSWGSSLVSTASSTMASFTSSVRNGMSNAVAAVQSGVSQMVSVARSAAGSMAGAGQSIGVSLGQGIAAGINSMIGSVAAAAANLVRSAVNAARAAGAITSPSKVMRDQVGKMLAKGTELGILQGLPGIIRAAEQMVHIPDLSSQSMRYATVGMGAGGGNGYGGSSYVDNRQDHRSFTITQLPGESGEAFYRRFVRQMDADEFDALGPVG